ncbi:MAG: outer membrane lipoprotein chaperone LolA [Acidobacteria bacterium]|nr:outer membrane lipoprotein chaperone LolA [Acidobacteriota bacterium]
MKSILVLSLALVASVSFAAGNAAIERSLEVTAGQQADFVQKFTPKGFTRERIEKGSVVFGEAPRMRWTYASPEEKLFVFDGSTSWLYAPADRQVMVARLTEEDRKGLPFVILSDSKALRASYEVRETASNGLVTTSLTPRTTAALVRNLVVVTDARDGRPRRIEYIDRQGNRTVFEFANYRPATIGAATFRFDPPPGVEVVRQ